ncbi:unnamed protein product [Rhizophagus irregularis]|nr:unnamed protein product [Rhizophagus irregularis]
MHGRNEKFLTRLCYCCQEHEELIKYKDNHDIKDHANHYNELLGSDPSVSSGIDYNINDNEFSEERLPNSALSKF